MNCRSYHARGQDPRCPYCVIRIMYRALERLDPHAPELTPAVEILAKAEKENDTHRMD